ncbi:hypothetical protein IU433_10905 [Nocardia puris]|uniref:Uncharacterized protein n=1 Tax=Nocardia puris TaxID=208602 RepID=A0A366DQX6_9NOCA|nr:hypothetical protein [Nocardia puris]MBF6211020.1 hypothetical protein [Nocardia puris]MBF6364616.1 hypothetical protein [Nocardia puris]MBF6459545.1 hypothetical protein [Nocardia puris]RBO92491.1 hypothetical protein DFR74_103134 [Nocardia puris]
MRVKKMMAGALVSVPLLFGLGMPVAEAAPTHVAFQIPVVKGLEVGPGGVPGGSFGTIGVVGTVGETPGAATFSIPVLAPYDSQYNYRWITVHWRNLQTGATGSVDIRHWTTNPTSGSTGYAASLPTAATAPTGPGPILATATEQREQWNAPPMPISLIPGTGVLLVS